ncbi:MAG: hypothetical protein ACOX6T_08405 [Myxococcales bacterium]|jgi:hypothetical protein
MSRSLIVAALVFLLASPALAAEAKKTKQATPPPSKAKVQDCGRDLSCLSIAAKTCARAAADHEVDLSMFGQRSTTRLEIVGRDGERCIFRTTLKSASFKLSAEARKESMRLGRTAAELDRDEREGN